MATVTTTCSDSEAKNMNVSPEESSTLKSNQNAGMTSDSQPSPKATDSAVELPDSPLSASASSSASSPSAVSVKASDAADIDGAPSSDSAAKETDANIEEAEPAELKIPFAPGDHITRWEMLPIAWPIQVHGIVLEVHEDAVVLVDFGLAAVPKGKNHKKKKVDSKKRCAAEEESESNVEEIKQGQEPDSKDGLEKRAEKKDQQHARKAIEKFQRGFRKERNRLNVQTLTTQKEISKWSKVNYDGSLFGFGNNKENGQEIKDNKNDEEAEEGKSSTGNENPRKGKRESWWGNWKKGQEKRKAERETRRNEKTDNTGKSTNSSDNTITTSTGGINELEVESAHSSSTPTDISGCGDASPWWCRVSMQRGKRRQPTDGKVTATAMMEASKSGDLVQEFKKNSMDDEADFLLELEKRQMRKSLQKQHDDYHSNEETSSGTATESDPPKSTSNEQVNNVHIGESGEKFAEEKKEEHEALQRSSLANEKAAPLSVITDDIEISQAEATSSSGSPVASPSTSTNAESESESESSPKSASSPSDRKRKQESKADPQAVVLARTRWLLKHGEGILPPYHAFSSNSECIAVFCKTGYWSTLQADIFLHSTAIGNAKSTVVMTLGVAASVPILAPVVGAVGLGAVVAPWFYLDKQKKAAKETQQKLADQFWAQAEPEVIVACVKEWSNLESLEEMPEELTAETLQKVGGILGEEAVATDEGARESLD
ncbi:MAG: hypothetical protein SGBAC_007774 [Bacillariaceae sp.]